MNNIINKVLLILFGFLLFTVTICVYHFCYAPKVGYIDSLRLYNEYVGKKELQKKYEDQRGRSQGYLDSLFLDLQHLERKMGEGSKPSAEQLEIYSTKKRVFSQLTENFEKQNKELEQKYLDLIWQNLNQYIKDYGTANNFDYILGATGSGSIMYANEKRDLTKDVIEYANKKYLGK